MRRVILASGSPRRKELLAQTGIEFEVIPGEIDEDAAVKVLGSGASDPARVVEALSLNKAEAVAAQIPEGIVIGSDTIVWDDGIMGKPKDRADAYQMLRRLQGRVHSVFTGVTVLVKTKTAHDAEDGKNAADPEDGKTAVGAVYEKEMTEVKKHVFFCETKVEVYPMTEQETEAYLDTGEAMDKAGAYGIQGKFGLWVKRIDGDYNSVVGLPLSALWQVLKEYV